MSIFKGSNSTFHSYKVEAPIMTVEMTPVLAPILTIITSTW